MVQYTKEKIMSFEELRQRVEEIEARSVPQVQVKETFHTGSKYAGLNSCMTNVTKAYAKLNKVTYCY